MSGLAQNTESGFGAFSKADDLKKRILYTLFILIIYRFGTYVPLISDISFGDFCLVNASKEALTKL